jgi:hypothetical protein
MQRKKIRSYQYILLIFLTFVFFSCESKPNFLGRWQNAEDEGRIEFREDGTFVGTDNMGATFKGNYLINNENIKLEITHTDIMRKTLQPIINPEVVNAKISIKGDELQLIFINNQEGKVEIEKYWREN